MRANTAQIPRSGYSYAARVVPDDLAARQRRRAVLDLRDERRRHSGFSARSGPCSLRSASDVAIGLASTVLAEQIRRGVTPAAILLRRPDAIVALPRTGIVTVAATDESAEVRIDETGRR